MTTEELTTRIADSVQERGRKHASGEALIFDRLNLERAIADALGGAVAPDLRALKSDIVADMRRASDAADEAVGSSEYTVRLVALALIARHFLRECAPETPPDLRALIAPESRRCIYNAIESERRRQMQLKAAGRFKYTPADSECPDADRIACLGEEYGEVCGAALQASGAASDRTHADLQKELIHVSAVAVAWLEHLDELAALLRSEPAE